MKQGQGNATLFSARHHHAVFEQNMAKIKRDYRRMSLIGHVIWILLGIGVFFTLMGVRGLFR